MRFLKILSLAAALALPAAVQAIPVAGYELNSISGGAGGGSVNYTLGFLFRAEQDLLLTDLGLYTAGDVNVQAAHQVGLWELTSTGLVLQRSVTFAQGAAGTAQNGFLYADVADLTLNAGTRYVIGASNYGLGGNGSTAAGAWQANVDYNGITYLGGRWGWSNTPGAGSLSAPTIDYNQANFMWYASANFLYEDGTPAAPAVPEPSSLLLLALGSGLMALAFRRRKA